MFELAFCVVFDALGANALRSGQESGKTKSLDVRTLLSALFFELFSLT